MTIKLKPNVYAKIILVFKKGTRKKPDVITDADNSECESKVNKIKLASQMEL